MKASLRRMTVVTVLGLTVLGLTLMSLTGCSQEEVINNSSKFIAELITSSIESEKDQVSLSEEQINLSEEQIKEDEPEIIKQQIVEDECWQNGVYQYYYGKLNVTQKETYNQMYETVKTMSEETILCLSDDITEEDISIIYRALRYDHPEIYWIQNYQYIVDGNNMYFYPTYLVNTEEKSLYDNQLEYWTDEIIKTVDKDWSDYEKELALYDYIVENTEYNLDSDLNQSLISVVQGESVCLGYTKAFKYLCDKVELGCIVIEGINEDEEAHSWNKVNIDGNWYNVDSTNSNTTEMFSENYDKFNITDELISLRYTEISIGENESISRESSIEFEYPIVNSIEADYYNMKGLYIESLDEIEGVVSNHLEEGTVTIRLGEQCDMKEQLQEYMKHIEFKDTDGKTLNIKCLNYVTIEHIRLLVINWD